MKDPTIPGAVSGRPRSRASAFRAAIEATASLAVGALVFGLLFGSTAVATGLSEFEALLMSLWVFAGGVQFAALALWQEPLPVLAIAVSSLLISGRHVLMGLALAPRLRRAGGRHPYAAVFLLTDVNAVLTLRHDRPDHLLTFFVASGGLMFAMWIAGSALGLYLPDALDPITVASLDYAGTIFFAILMVVLVKGNDAPSGPWLLAGAVAAAAAQLVPATIALVLAVGAGAAWSLMAPRRSDA